MKETFKLDVNELKRARMAMIMGLDPYRSDSWPLDVIDSLIAEEAENGLELVLEKIQKMYTP